MSARPETALRRRQILDDILRETEARLDDPDLTLDDICAAVFTSRRQAQRVFEEAGLTFRGELARMRVLEAGRLLRADPDLRVLDVARAVGYRQPAQFAKAFRRHLGCSPSEFRDASERFPRRN